MSCCGSTSVGWRMWQPRARRQPPPKFCYALTRFKFAPSAQVGKAPAVTPPRHGKVESVIDDVRCDERLGLLRHPSCLRMRRLIHARYGWHSFPRIHTPRYVFEVEATGPLGSPQSKEAQIVSGKSPWLRARKPQHWRHTPRGLTRRVLRGQSRTLESYRFGATRSRDGAATSGAVAQEGCMDDGPIAFTGR